MKRSKRTPRMVAVAVDCGTPERARHGTLAPRETGTAGQVGRRVKHACRLDWYLDKSSILDRQHEAGLRFRRDWHLAMATRRIIGTYGPRISGGGDFSEAQLAARARLAKAISVVGAHRTGLLIDVCCDDQWASGRLPELRETLTALADFYRVPRLSQSG